MCPGCEAGLQSTGEPPPPGVRGPPRAWGRGGAARDPRGRRRVRLWRTWHCGLGPPFAPSDSGAREVSGPGPASLGSSGSQPRVGAGAGVETGRGARGRRARPGGALGGPGEIGSGHAALRGGVGDPVATGPCFFLTGTLGVYKQHLGVTADTTRFSVTFYSVLGRFYLTVCRGVTSIWRQIFLQSFNSQASFSGSPCSQ